MKKLNAIIYFSLITIITIIAYFQFQSQWVSFRIAEIAFENRSYKRAQNNYIESLERNMPIEKVANRLAISSEHLNQEIQIIQYFQRKIKNSKDKIQPIYELGTYYLELHAWEKAVTLFQQLPLENKKYLIPAVQGLIGNKEYDLACHYLHKYLDKHPDDDIRWLYAKKLLIANDPERAIKQYSLFLNEFPDEDLARIEMINLLLDRKDFRQALEEFDHLSLGKIDYPSRRVLGDLYLYFGYEKEGKKLLLKQEKKGASDPKLRRIIEGNTDALLADLKERRVYPREESQILQQVDEHFFNEQNDKGMAALFHLLRYHKKNEQYILDRIGDGYRFFFNDLKKAQLYYEKALAIDRSDPIELKLGFVLSQENKLSEAYPLLLEGLENFPNDLSVQLELARIDLEHKREKEGRDRIKSVLKIIPNDSSALFILANHDAMIGHVKKAKKEYLPSLDSNRYDLHYAYLLQYWGDFYRAEKIYRDYLILLENDNVLFSLAWLLVSTDRFEEATALYEQLLAKEKNKKKAHLFLAKTQTMEKKYTEALENINHALLLEKNNLEALEVKGEILYQDKKFEASIESYEKLLPNTSDPSKIFTAIGKNYLMLEKHDLAKEAFEQAIEHDPKYIEAYFYLAYPNEILSPSWQKSLTIPIDTAEEKTALADLYSHYGHNDEAISLYESALTLDSQYYPAKLKLGQLLARDKQFKLSEEIFDELLREFPHDYLFMLWKARLNSWARKFTRSLYYYRKLNDEIPSDPQVLREMARTYEWDKEIFDALRTYNKGLSPSVDCELRDRLLLSDLPRTWVLQFLPSLNNNHTPIGLYEKISANSFSLSPNDQKVLKTILQDLRPKYFVQKSLYLEKEAAFMFWQQKYAHSLPYLNALIKLNPQNTEALFDLGQAKCQLGLCKESQKVYEKIIEDAPSHNLSLKALEKSRVKDNTYLQLTGQHWSATGRGEIDQIRRWRTHFEVGIPIHCRHLLYVEGLHWYERPSFDKPSEIFDQRIIGKHYTSYGYSVGYKGVFSPYVSADAEISQKFYYEGKFASKTMGFLHLNFRAYESLQFSIAFDRINHMGNYFALSKGIQYNQWKGEIRSLILRRLETVAQSRLQVYKDNNTLQHHDLETALILNTFPKILKVGFRGEYRDSRRQNRFLYNSDGQLVDLFHPYWTPDKYFGGRAFLKWRHDLSKEKYCEGNKHVYDITLASGSDTELNPFYSVEGSWDYQMTDHLTFNVRGMIHKSKVWDADELWLRLKYQF